MQTAGGAPTQEASAALNIWTKTVPTSRRTHSSKITVRKRPHASDPTERSVTVVPSWKRVRPSVLTRSTMGMNWR
jgi:hypothetical protein